LFQNPQHPYTRGLLACRPSLEYRLKRLPLVADFLQPETTDFVQTIENWKVKPAETAERLQQLQQQPPLVEVKNLKTWFPAKKNFLGKTLEYVKAVDGVSFQVHPGETLGLVGESGSGKTTLGRSILHLIPPTEGTVLVENKDLATLPAAEMRRFRREMQIIFQDPYSSLNPRLTIGSAIIEPMQVHRIGANERERRDRAVELLQTVGLDEGHLQRYPHEFSGGQRQRICIARALAVEPKFIICDEAVSSLDVSVQAQVLNLLMKLREKQQLTYIFISHDLSVVKQMSDRMLVMHAGKIVEAGAADAIYENPQSGYTQKLIAAIPKNQFLV
jgi:peptide/nickel transport system ATP-binding protein